MKLFGSRSYVEAPPAPKMPPGLIELMEGLTKEVLSNNPTEVYEFCAEHMRKLIELRDHDTPKRCLTLEEKVLKANSIIRQRAEKRRQKYDNDMQILQQAEQLMHTSEIIPDNQCLSVKAANDLLSNNSKGANEHSNNNTDTKSEHIDVKETNEYSDDVAITCESVDDTQNTDPNEQQMKPDKEIINNNELNPTQYEVGDNNNEESAILADYTKEDNVREPYSDDRNDDNEKNDGQLVDERYSDKCEEIESDNTIVTDPIVAAIEIKDSQIYDPNSQIEVIQQSVSSEKEINTNTIIIEENNQNEVENKIVITDKDGNEKKDKIDIQSENTQKNLEEHSVTDDEGNQNVIKETPVINVNNQNKMEGQFVTNDGGQNEINVKAVIDEKNNSKEIEGKPFSVEEDIQNEIKDEDNSTNSENSQKEIEVPVSNKDNQNEIIEDAVIKCDNQKKINEGSASNGEGDQAFIKEDNEQQEAQEKVDLNNEDNEMHDQRGSNCKNTEEEIKKQSETESSSEVKTDIEIEGHVEESVLTIDEAKSEESAPKQDKPFESTLDTCEDKLKGDLNAVKGDSNKNDLEIFNGAKDSSITINKEHKLISEHVDPDTGSVSDNKHVEMNAEPTLSDQLLTQETDKNLVNESEENTVQEIIDKPLIINIGLQQNNQDDLIDINTKSKAQNSDNCEENDPVEFKESETVESKNSKPMDLETAAITIQKVFRNFLFRSKTSSFDDSTNIEFNIFDHNCDSKDTVYSNQTQILNKDKRPNISRMDTVLQTVNEEKSLSLSTDDSSTLSSAATVIQAHIRGFLVRNRLNRNKTISSTSLADSGDPPASLETDPDPGRNKTVLNIHIVPEGSHFMSRDESMLTSVELSLDGSPPVSSNLHPLGYDKTERRKQLKREDAVQSISPPSNNSTRFSEEHDSVKEILLHDNKHETEETVNNVESTEDSDSDDVLSKGTVEEKQIENPDPAIILNKNTKDAAVASSDELDVITPFENVEEKNDGGLDGKKLVHSGEFHDVVLPTKVSRNDTSVVRDFQNVLAYFLVWNSS